MKTTKEQNEPTTTNRTTRRVFVFALFVSIVSMIAFSYSQIVRDDVMQITQLRVVGEFAHVTAQDVKSAIKPYLRGNLVTVDVDSIHSAVEKIPWVNFVWVDRVWPNELRIRVVEEKAVAIWDGKGLMNRDGIVFVTSDTKDFDLPVLSGPDGTQKLLLDQFLIFREIANNAQLEIDRLSLNERRAWTMRIANEFDVIIGREQSYTRLLRFMRVYKESLATSDKTIKRVDLRYTNGFALEFS